MTALKNSLKVVTSILAAFFIASLNTDNAAMVPFWMANFLTDPVEYYPLWLFGLAAGLGIIRLGRRQIRRVITLRTARCSMAQVIDPDGPMMGPRLHLMPVR